MDLLPYEHFTIRTSLSEAEVHRRLADSIEPYQMLRWFWGNHRPYQGSISADEFQVTRIIGYRNSFLPRISGRIGSDLGQTTIDIKMMLHPLVIAFLAFWMLFVGLGFLAAVVSTMNSLLNPAHASDASPAAILATGFMLVFAAAMTVGFFKLEALKSKRFFRELLEDIEAN